MTWEYHVLRQFQMLPKNPTRGAFHGPYNKLMYSLFPLESDYLVAARYETAGTGPSPYFRYEILFKDTTPVMMLELKRPGDLQYGSKRQEAILQIQQRLKDLRPRCPLPVLHVVSAFGTRLCFCKAHSNRPIQPTFNLADAKGVTDLAPQEYWDCDILEKDGEKRFKAMVREIKKACAAL
ncbi:hypothetical protein EI94DRAFT_1725634 [Lactarius quietus]|nr:hypothetical protein EI94DRAFT_1725634 [Lactarius quietus]